MSMSPSASNALGPQCLSCKKRRVRCDSTAKACRRCQNDNITCPGYVKPLRWNHFSAPRRGGDKLQRIPAETSQEDNKGQLILRGPNHDKELPLVLQSIEYYNTHILPSVSPAQLPFRRNSVPAEYWPLVPSVLKHMFIVIVKTRQAGKMLSDPALIQDLCYYRGRGLTGLQEMLSDSDYAAKDPHAIALLSVLFVMGADMQLCEEHWASHLEAARRIVASRGGIRECLQNPLINPGTIVNYIHTDIMSATACNAWMLNPRAVQSHLEYTGILSELEPDLLAFGHACPYSILEAITLTTVLRVSLQRPLTRLERQSMAVHAVNFESILILLETFEPAQWATNIANVGRRLPQREEDELPKHSISCLTSLAQCFKSAAILYLLLSTQYASTNAHTEPFFNAMAALSFHLEKVFSNAFINDHEGPLHTQLWKLSGWPLFVSAYVKVGWDIGLDGLETDLTRFLGIARALASTRLLDVQKFIRRIQEQRASQLNMKWMWDDGFGNRCAFVV